MNVMELLPRYSMRSVLSLCDLHFYVVVVLMALLASVMHADSRPGFPSFFIIAKLGAAISGAALVLGFLGLCPFELGFKRIVGWCIVNFATGSVLAAVIVVCTLAVAVGLRALGNALF
jgi:hypothetical protein